MSDVTHILAAIDAGDPQAAAQLLPLVYDELRRLAAAQMAGEKPGHSLDATALVHEAYLRLAGDQHFSNRRHFFAAAAEAMRRILIESARRQASLKRGGGLVRRELEESELIAPELSDDVLALDEALLQLAAVDAEAAELVKLRYFVGLTSQQTADVGVVASFRGANLGLCQSLALQQVEVVTFFCRVGPADCAWSLSSPLKKGTGPFRPSILKDF